MNGSTKLAAAGVAAFIASLSGASHGATAPLIEPQAFRSTGGVLDLMIIAETKPLTAFTFSGPNPIAGVYTVCPRPASGTNCPADNGTASSYGGFRLALQPGDRLKIRFVNKLPALPPEWLTRIDENPLLALDPTNLHTHGLVVAARPNSVAPPGIPVYGDFVFTSVFNPANGNPATYDPGAFNKLHAHGDVVSTGVVDYDIQLPKNHPLGAAWLHPHVHGIALNQVSAGLAGIISVGNISSYACADEACAYPVPESYVRHLILKDFQVRGDGVGNYQQDPTFCDPQKATENGVCSANEETYPGGKWFFTLNGQQYPSIPVGTPEGEIWRLTNASASVTYNMQLVNNQTGAPMAVQVLSLDGVSVSFPASATAGQVVQIGKHKIKLAKCAAPTPTTGDWSIISGLKQTYSSAPVCATELFMMPAGRAEIHVAYRDAMNSMSGAPQGATATLRSTGVQTGPAGDPWPAVNFASVSFSPGKPSIVNEAVHVKNGGAASTLSAGGIFVESVPGVKAAPLPAGCAPLAPGHRRRIYFGNPNIPGGAGPGLDAKGNPIFGLGYEEIDEFGKPVPNTFVDIQQFDPGMKICLPLANSQRPANEIWELYSLSTELHNFHIHQTKFRRVDPAAPSWSPLNPNSKQPGAMEDTIALPFAVAGPGSQPATNSDAASCTVADFKAGRCKTTPVYVKIPFSQIGTFVFHCHILEHEDGGMMAAIRVVPAPK